ncbi:MAG: leucine-rich repeat protein [Clostridia bacterium]|nr:leucine-rich repeat protein [Clostridia bacterium]
MASNKKLIVIVSILCIVAIMLTVGIAIVLVAMNVQLTSDINVKYISKNVDMKVSARYYAGNSVSGEMYIDGDTSKGTTLHFVDGMENSGTISPAVDTIEIDKSSKKLVFEYKFENVATDTTEVAAIKLTSVPAANNMKYSYGFSKTYTADVSTLELTNELDMRKILPGEVYYVYIVADVQRGVLGASLDGTFVWAMEETTLNTYQVSYNIDAASNGTGSSVYGYSYIDSDGNEQFTTSNPLPGHVKEASEFIPATPVIENYAFIGWYEDEARTIPYTGTDYVDSPITLYPLYAEGNSEFLGANADDYVTFSNDGTRNVATIDVLPYDNPVEELSVGVRSNSVRSGLVIGDGDLVIPDVIKYNNTVYFVTDINQTIDCNASIKNVVIGNFVQNAAIVSETLDDYASIEYVYVGRSVISLSFIQCVNLKTVYFANGLKTIPENSFLRCYSLKEIFVPSSVTEIGYSAFQDCTSLEKVTFQIGSKLEAVNYNSFTNCTSLKEIILPAGVTRLGSETEGGSFTGCTSLEKVYIPNSVNYIGDVCFKDCTSLSSVIFENGINLGFIPESCFENCTSLTRFTVPEGVTGIGRKAFANCTSLVWLSLPTNDSIETEAGYGGEWELGSGAPSYSCVEEGKLENESIEEFYARHMTNPGDYCCSLPSYWNAWE